MPKLVVLQITDSQADVIYDALEELRFTCDNEYSGESISDIQNLIFEACKVERNDNA